MVFMSWNKLIELHAIIIDINMFYDQVLNAKTRRAHELKRKLGVNVWNEFATDMGQGIKNVRESTA